ncbi:MAG: hypothetical protein QNJ12_03685 [Ilumatobacter sp.]|uniref:hypothetical protein n=1 Tax=Ilumatobacter sp. TaxID=1967498 RepID=UPI00260EE510|nr:hypothetical protein [Ilumatobacter sp.]MDJ0767864.1 hypothetical protein [Ilumatobacter sp.]
MVRLRDSDGSWRRARTPGPAPAPGDHLHHLHHRYFERNDGSRLVPIDVLFGTHHDGTAEAHGRMRARRRSGQPAGA